MSQQTPQSQYQQHNNCQQDISLSNQEIFTIFKNKGFNIDSEKAISEPTQEFYNNILVYSAFLILRVPLEEINQSDICNQLDLEMENGVKALQIYQKMRYIKQMLDLVGIDDFCSYDIIKPDKKKVRRTLVAITQYILYQETIISSHTQILDKNVQIKFQVSLRHVYQFIKLILRKRADEQKIKRYADELEVLKFHSDQLKDRKEAEKNSFQEKMQFYEKLTTEYQDLLRQKQNLIKQKSEYQNSKLQMEKSIHQAQEDIQKLIENNQKEKMKIVKSPFKLKDQCLSLQNEIEQQMKELDIIKKDYLFICMKNSYNDKLLQKIRKHLTLPSLTLEEMIKKESEANKILKNAKNEIKELQLKEEVSNQSYQKIFDYHLDLIAQLDQKNKLAEEKKKTYEDEISNMLKEQQKLKEDLSEVQKTISEIQQMQANLEQKVIQFNINTFFITKEIFQRINFRKQLLLQHFLRIHLFHMTYNQILTNFLMICFNRFLKKKVLIKYI
ncbi:hypothetical protein ABPG74_011840 [Tetrahymena malaccensis]